MKKLLTLFAISTITIVPSITLVSCFNNEKPRYFEFDENNAILSIEKAIERRNFTLSAGDFGATPADPKSKETSFDIKTAMIEQISNSFTPRKSADAAKEWLNKQDENSPIPEIGSVGETTTWTISETKPATKADEVGEETTEVVNIHFKIEEGNSFTWLFSEWENNLDFFTKGKFNHDFSQETKSITIPSYLTNSWISLKQNNKLDDESTQMQKVSIAKNIYEILINQAIWEVSQSSDGGKKNLYRLNSSEVITRGANGEAVEYFSKNNQKSLVKFLMLIGNENWMANPNFLLETIDKLVTELTDNSGTKSSLFKTNFFDFKIGEEQNNNINNKEEPTEFIFKVVIK